MPPRDELPPAGPPPELDDIRPLGFRPGGRARAGPARPGGMLADRRRWRTLALVALVLIIAGVALRKHAPTCSTHPPSGPNSADAGFWVASAVAGVPCLSTGRSVYGLEDSGKQAMIGLDPIADPRGGYLGVYSSQAGQVMLGHSSDLATWRRIRGLGLGASPTLEAVPGGGYLLAFQSGSRVQLRFFSSLSTLLAARHAASIALPVRLSSTRNGAPSFRSVAWNGGLRHSVLTIAFDYGAGGLERLGIGQLRGFRSWSAQRDSGLDAQLDQRGLSGNHGQQRQFIVAGRTWRIFEAQELADSKAGDSGGWHIALDDLVRGQVFALKLGTANGTFDSSFGRPVVRVLPAPAGGGQALVVSTYVFGSGPARSESGELLYWTPIGAG